MAHQLSCRVGGAGSEVAVLVHGLVATGDVFGRSADRLAAQCRVVVPDLPGFGRSVDVQTPESPHGDLVDSITAVAAEFAPTSPMVLGAHSMGSSIALTWAMENPVRVRRVVCLGAPIWPSAVAAQNSISDAGLMARTFILNTRVARRICRLNCRHRKLSGWLAVAMAPRWPTQIARQASQHTWDAYRQAFDQHVLGVDWEAMLSELDRNEVSVLLVWGSEDSVGDIAYAQRVTAHLPNVSIELVDGADHTLPASHPGLLPDRLAG